MNVKCIPTGPFGVNTYVVYADGPAAFVVDPAGCSFCSDEDAVTSFLFKNKLVCTAIILTHGHFDHVAGIAPVKKMFPAAPILISSADKDFIGKDSAVLQSVLLEPMGFSAFIPAVSFLPEQNAFLADGKNLFECTEKFFCFACESECKKVFSSVTENMPEDFSVTLSLSEIKSFLSEWTVIATPGHSKGSVCIYSEKNRTLISGDTMFFQSYGRTDLHGGDEITLWKSLKKLKAQIPSNTLVYPGHDTKGFLFSEGCIL